MLVGTVVFGLFILFYESHIYVVHDVCQVLTINYVPSMYLLRQNKRLAVWNAHHSHASLWRQMLRKKYVLRSYLLRQNKRRATWSAHNSHASLRHLWWQVPDDTVRDKLSCSFTVTFSLYAFIHIKTIASTVSEHVDVIVSFVCD